MTVKVKDIVGAIESVAPASLQESWDNTGLLVGDPEASCRGVMVCVDVTPAIIDEALSRGCSMVVSHHPLIFKGVKRVNGHNRVEESIVKAIKNDVAIYCGHTSVDSAPARGVSYVLASMLGMRNVEVLDPQASDPEAGLGVIGDLAESMAPEEFVALVKSKLDSPVARCTPLDKGPQTIKRVGLCGGSGSEYIGEAIARGAQAYLTSDTRYHDFCDYCGRVLIVDVGHFESEYCTKRIFYDIISEKFPNFAVYFSELEFNPISYI